jgi:glycosyltransferase involved in cell wall biosynthesis
MSKEFLVSIIIPVYNVAKFLSDSIKSVQNQTYENLEIVLINDASTDNSLEICKEFAINDKRIKLLEHEINRGLSVSRNDGLDVATGEFICFVDSDDSLCENAIEMLVDVAKKRKVELLGFNANIISSSGISTYVKCIYTSEIMTGEKYLTRMLKAGHVNAPVWLYFYKSSLIQKKNLRFAAGRIFEDEVWTPEVLLSANAVSYLDISAYNYYIRESSIMTRNDINYKKYTHALINCKELIQLSHIFESKKNENLLRDYIARICMESTKYLIVCNESDLSKIDYRFIKSNIHCKATYIKYWIFKFNKRLYFKLKGLNI